METINQRIEYVRVISGLNQKDFAEKCGISGAHISRIIGGLKHPSAQSVFKISINFNVKMEWLIKGIEPMLNNDDDVGKYSESINIETKEEAFERRLKDILYSYFVNLKNYRGDEKIFGTEFFDEYIAMMRLINKLIENDKYDMLSEVKNILDSLIKLKSYNNK